jgi:DNA-binding transcriptional LysR family regulator
MEERLKKFVRLVDAGGFTRAARDLHISQPALSVSIAKLERELRTPLLVHGVRPLALTAAGRLAYATGKELQVQTGNLRLQLAELSDQQLEVSLGMIDSVAGLLLTSAAGVEALERQATVSLVVDNSRNLLRAVEKAELDLVFVVERPQFSELLEVVERVVEPLVVVGVPEQTQAASEGLRAGHLPHFISYDQASTTHQLVAAALQKRGVAPEPAFYSTSPEVMLRLVLLGKGVAALPYLLVRDLLVSGELAVIGASEPLLVQRPVVAVKRRDVLLAAPLLRTTRLVARLFETLRADELLKSIG